jgi:hypothetical protein
MAYLKSIVLVVFLVTAGVAGCTQGRDDSALSTLVARLEQLERRVAMADNRAELGGLTQRLSNVEARLTAVEGQRAVAERHDPTTPPADVDRQANSGSTVRSPSSRAEAVSEQSKRVKSIAEEDRARMASIREQFRDNADPVARRQAMSELRAWRRAQVDALRLRNNASGRTK